MRTEQEEADHDRDDRGDQHGRGGHVLRRPGPRVDPRACERDRMLERRVRRLEDEHECDGEHQNDPLPSLQSEESTSHESEQAHAQLDPEVALRL